MKLCFQTHNKIENMLDGYLSPLTINYPHSNNNNKKTINCPNS